MHWLTLMLVSVTAGCAVSKPFVKLKQDCAQQGDNGIGTCGFSGKKKICYEWIPSSAQASDYGFLKCGKYDGHVQPAGQGTADNEKAGVARKHGQIYIGNLEKGSTITDVSKNECKIKYRNKNSGKIVDARTGNDFHFDHFVDTRKEPKNKEDWRTIQSGQTWTTVAFQGCSLIVKHISGTKSFKLFHAENGSGVNKLLEAESVAAGKNPDIARYQVFFPKPPKDKRFYSSRFVHGKNDNGKLVLFVGTIIIPRATEFKKELDAQEGFFSSAPQREKVLYENFGDYGRKESPVDEKNGWPDEILEAVKLKRPTSKLECEQFCDKLTKVGGRVCHHTRWDQPARKCYLSTVEHCNPLERMSLRFGPEDWKIFFGQRNIPGLLTKARLRDFGPGPGKKYPSDDFASCTKIELQAHYSHLLGKMATTKPTSCKDPQLWLTGCGAHRQMKRRCCGDAPITCVSNTDILSKCTECEDPDLWLTGCHVHKDFKRKCCGVAMICAAKKPGSKTPGSRCVSYMQAKKKGKGKKQQVL